MLTYRQIESEIDFARKIYDSEMQAPRWFRDAFKVWIKSFDEYLIFWKNCAEIYGLFDDERLLCAVYLEHKSEAYLEIHISVVASCPNKELVRYFASLRRLKRAEGFTAQVGWLASRNRQMLAVAEDAGFHKTGLKMSCGHTGRTVFTWAQVAAVHN